MSNVVVTPDMTMEEILSTVPAAQRALFQRYHIGGCSSCGYEPSDTLADVCKDRNILDVNEVIEFIKQAQEVDERMQVDAAQVKAWLDSDHDFTFLDVRMPEELELARLPQAEALDYDDSERYMAMPKNRRIVFVCKSGIRSLDVAAYFKGHGFTEVYSLRGGLDAWREQVDASIPEY